VAEYKVTVYWERKDQLFTDNRYSRGHTWTFDGDVEVPASSSPHVVPIPYSNASAVDPEEAFVAFPFQLSHAMVSFHCSRAWFLR
jgi:hypothetical protein